MTKCKHKSCKREALFRSEFCWDHLQDREEYKKLILKPGKDGRINLIRANLKGAFLWGAHLEGANLRKVRFGGANLHTLRHTFASHLIMKGVDPRTVQEYMGHSTIQVTEKYSHLSKSHKREAINVLSFAEKVEKKVKQTGKGGL
jgi:integrase